MWPEASPIGQKDLDAFHSHKNSLPEPAQARKFSLLSVRKLSGTGDVRTEAYPQELGDVLSLSLTQLCF